VLQLGFSQATLLQSDCNAILIDTGIRVGAEKYARLLAAVQMELQDIKLIVITHGHSDHYGEAAMLQKLTGAPILCHEKAAMYLSSGQNAAIVARNALGDKVSKLLRHDVLTAAVPVIPDITITAGFDLSSYGFPGKIIPTPGHTDCSLSVVLASGQAVTGDLIVANPFGGKPCLAYFAVSEQALFASVKKLLDCAHTLYSGHGGPFYREAVNSCLLAEYKHTGLDLLPRISLP